MTTEISLRCRRSRSRSKPLQRPRSTSKTARSIGLVSRRRKAAAGSAAETTSKPARVRANVSSSTRSWSSSTSKIVATVALPRERQGEPDGRAAAGRALEADLAAVGLDDAPRDTEPEADPGAVVAGAGAVEALEEPGLVRRRDAGPAVADAQPDGAAGARGRDADRLPLRAVLRGVGQQVHQGLARVAAVGQHRRQVGWDLAL